ncbi:hypothetical protein AA0472_2843 [Acetobacter estunensis NRIC 0472]|uniref:hypothetical protein n=1 Tax=Acetobacter estunensis TaxID=104097 RepID=UPI001F558B13|nr:hypothetical protein [Acetobacter estunensis]GBQ28912.1 hypothetical protein AA0472_2843 [Acetobacter estunensis NRIC 0472]
MNSSRHFMSVSFTCAVIVGLATGSVLSQAHAATREQQTAACKGDALKFCTFDIPNEKKIASCLQAKREKLSPACKAMFPEKKSGAKKKPK